MRSFILFVFVILTHFNNYAQTSLSIFTGPRPADFNNDSGIKQNGFKKELIYRYSKKEKNKDSILLVVKYFDSSGACIEKDEYNDKNQKMQAITNYTYTAGLLTRIQTQESLSYSDYYNLTTYDYDEKGNRINEENYYRSTKNKPYILTFQSEKKFEYDSINNYIIKTFERLSTNLHLHDQYYYQNNKLQEDKAFDTSGKWFYSYTYEYDSSLHTKTKYLKNENGKRLESTDYYNDTNQLIQEIDYDHGYYTFIDHYTCSFEYNNGLLVNESSQLTDGSKFYFKYYYFH